MSATMRAIAGPALARWRSRRLPLGFSIGALTAAITAFMLGGLVVSIAAQLDGSSMETQHTQSQSQSVSNPHATATPQRLRRNLTDHPYFSRS